MVAVELRRHRVPDRGRGALGTVAAHFCGRSLRAGGKADASLDLWLEAVVRCQPAPRRRRPILGATDADGQALLPFTTGGEPPPRAPVDTPQCDAESTEEAVKVKRPGSKRSRTLVLGKALGYAINQESYLRLFLEHGELPIHNNLSELILRQTVVGRKNWLFARSEGGAHAAATMYTLIGSCYLQGIDSWF